MPGSACCPHWRRSPEGLRDTGKSAWHIEYYIAGFHLQDDPAYGQRAIWKNASVPGKILPAGCLREVLQAQPELDIGAGYPPGTCRTARGLATGSLPGRVLQLCDSLPQHIHVIGEDASCPAPAGEILFRCCRDNPSQLPGRRQARAARRSVAIFCRSQAQHRMSDQVPRRQGRCYPCRWCARPSK